MANTTISKARGGARLPTMNQWRRNHLPRRQYPPCTQIYSPTPDRSASVNRLVTTRRPLMRRDELWRTVRPVSSILSANFCIRANSAGGGVWADPVVDCIGADAGGLDLNQVQNAAGDAFLDVTAN